jgi:hypothetical protein
MIRKTVLVDLIQFGLVIVNIEPTNLLQFVAGV